MIILFDIVRVHRGTGMNPVPIVMAIGFLVAILAFAIGVYCLRETPLRYQPIWPVSGIVSCVAACWYSLSFGAGYSAGLLFLVLIRAIINNILKKTRDG